VLSDENVGKIGQKNFVRNELKDLVCQGMCAYNEPLGTSTKSKENLEAAVRQVQEKTMKGLYLVIID